MANILANGLSAIILMLVVMQIIFVTLYTNRFKDNLEEFDRINPKRPDGFGVPPKERAVAVVLCLRGADPALADCLQGLSRQRYSNYQVHVVVDSMDDPSLNVVNQYSSTLPDLQVYPIGNLRSTCSAKCSAILTAIERIPDSVEIIAFVDADTSPDRNWLSDLIAPFRDVRVGASTGDRWFEADQWTLGTALRQVWNGAAIVQMGIYNIAWGGSLAIRTELLQTTKLLDRWQNAFCEDTLLANEMRPTGLQLVRAPGLVVVNRETTGFSEAVNWITRQLITIRLHNENWPLIQAHAAATMCCNLALLLGLILVVTPQSRSGCLLLSFYGVYQIINAIMLRWIHLVVTENLQNRSVRSLQPADDRVAPPLSLIGMAILSAQWVYPYACFIATFCRRISWRGIEYNIKGDGNIEMVEYMPFSRSQQPIRNDASDSIH